MRRSRCDDQLEPVLDAIPVGRRLLFVSPITENPRSWRAPWTELVRRRGAQYGGALEADRRRAAGVDGPLLGVPIALKDDLDAAGHVTSWGTRARRTPARADGPVVTTLKAAGITPIVQFNGGATGGLLFPLQQLMAVYGPPAPINSWIFDKPGANIDTPTNVQATTHLQRWIKAGYAVVRTDYDGLGTPGVHQYLVGTSEGRSVLDAVRAAR